MLCELPGAYVGTVRIILTGSVLLAETCFGHTYGTWILDAARSTFTGDIRPRRLTLRIEKHPKGEVLTIDRVETDGRSTSSSTVLYFDGTAREFQDFGCTGTQSSTQIDRQTVEIVRTCKSGEWSRMTRRNSVRKNELVLEIVAQQLDGRRVQRRLVLNRQ